MGSVPLQRVDENTVDPQVVREESERVLGHPLFAKSKRYGTLMKYIVDHTLDGEFECLKERIIGIEVFGRSTDYDTSADATVRVAVKEVRKRLAAYFDDPAHQNELRIDLPTGSYVAKFTLPDRRPDEAAVEMPVVKVGRPTIRRMYFAIPAAVVILLAGLWGLIQIVPSTSAIDEFWAPMLKSSGPVLIVLASPPTNNPLSTGVVLPPASGTTLWQFIARQSNFPISELNSANSISSFLGTKGRQTATHLAKTTTLSDLRGGPAVILGSYPNEWAMRLGAGLHFRFQQDASHSPHWIQDTSDPGRRNWAIDTNAELDQVNREYAMITRAVDATTGQWWIGIAGTTVLGTLGAQQMILDPSAMSGLSRQLPKGWQHKNMQVVIEFQMVNGSLGSRTVVGTYLW